MSNLQQLAAIPASAAVLHTVCQLIRAIHHACSSHGSSVLNLNLSVDQIQLVKETVVMHGALRLLGAHLQMASLHALGHIVHFICLASHSCHNCLGALASGPSPLILFVGSWEGIPCSH